MVATKPLSILSKQTPNAAGFQIGRSTPLMLVLSVAPYPKDMRAVNRQTLIACGGADGDHSAGGSCSSFAASSRCPRFSLWGLRASVFQTPSLSSGEIKHIGTEDTEHRMLVEHLSDADSWGILVSPQSRAVNGGGAMASV
jgi:hypothetical protein